MAVYGLEILHMSQTGCGSLLSMAGNAAVHVKDCLLINRAPHSIILHRSGLCQAPGTQCNVHMG